MSELKRFDEAAWDQFFEFLYPTGEQIPDTTIDDELQAAGIDITAALQKLTRAIESAEVQRRLQIATNNTGNGIANDGE